MRTINKSAIPAILFVALLFLVSFLWRKNKSQDIKQNSQYAIARITKQLGSLKNGNQWYYEFSYNNKIYESYRSTHVGYDVKIDDYFLVQFSFKNPEHSALFYEYQLRPDKIEYKNYVGDTIPISSLYFHKKKSRL